MSEENQESVAAPAGGGGGKLVPVLTVVNLLATLGIVGMLVVSFQKTKHTENLEDLALHDESHAAGESAKAVDPSKSAQVYGKMIALEQFTVNLSTPGSTNPRFARVNISLEVSNPDIETEVNQKMPQVRNAVIDLFNSKTPGELATADGREYLKEELRNAINGFLVQGKIKGVYFTNFSLGG